MTVATLAPIVTLDETSHVYTHREGFHPPSVTQILGFVPPFAGRFDRVAPELLEYKRRLGSQVHRATHYYDEGTLDIHTVDPVLTPYLLAWQKFRMEKSFVPVVMETAVFHPDYGYAGTLDRIGRMDGGLWLVDLKCGPAQDGHLAGPQTAAYEKAAGHMDMIPRGSLVHRCSVHLGDDGAYRMVPHTNRRDWHVFLAALELWNFACDGK